MPTEIRREDYEEYPSPAQSIDAYSSSAEAIRLVFTPSKP